MFKFPRPCTFATLEAEIAKLAERQDLATELTDMRFRALAEVGTRAVAKFDDLAERITELEVDACDAHGAIDAISARLDALESAKEPAPTDGVEPEYRITLDAAKADRVAELELELANLRLAN